MSASADRVFAAMFEEIDRLRVVEAAAREYAESRRAWEEAIRAESLDASYLASQDRQDAARANLLALFPAEDAALDEMEA